MTKWGQSVITRLKTLKRSQYWLAAEVGVNPSYLNHCIHGHASTYPSQDLKDRIEAVLSGQVVKP